MSSEESESRRCYICLDSEGKESEWVSPCNCAGSLKWVHQSCLIRWVREQLQKNAWTPAFCPQCKTKLNLVPKQGKLVAYFEFVDDIISPVWKFFAGCGFGFIACKSASELFGIIARSQVCGVDATLAVLSDIGVWRTDVHLHYITFGLVIVNAIPWDRFMLRKLRSLSSLPKCGRFLPEEIPYRYKIPWEMSFSRIVVNSLLLPFFANAIGYYWFSFVNSARTRVLLGGLVFLGAKGFYSMYILQKQEVRRKRMTITPYRASIRPSITE